MKSYFKDEIKKTHTKIIQKQTYSCLFSKLFSLNFPFDAHRLKLLKVKLSLDLHRYANSATGSGNTVTTHGSLNSEACAHLIAQNPH